ncbi:MAG: sigma-54 dependent transcriptional regulator [Thermoanaerobaculia bacterium]
MARILILTEERSLGLELTTMLAGQGYETRLTSDFDLAVEDTLTWQPAVVLLELTRSGEGDQTLAQLQAADPGAVVVTIAGSRRPGSAKAEKPEQAFELLSQPVDRHALLAAVRRAVEHQRNGERRSGGGAEPGFDEIIGSSPKIQELFRVLAKVAPVDATVLATGESGTGKELVARAIHRKSRRAHGPFVAVNCSAIPESLIEAEFFGHERGAFTDAQASRPGKFELADGGTLFLDEVCDLSLAAQAKLLRALQERKVFRIGSNVPRPVDVRVIAATNKNPEQEMLAGLFRDDLYWRLNVVSLRLPALRERRSDLPVLIDHFLRKFNRDLGLRVTAVAPEALRLLLAYSWPGNIRELENTLCQAMILADGPRLEVKDLPARIFNGPGQETPTLVPLSETGTLAAAVENVIARVEKQLILARLAEHHGNRTATAESLGISRKTLFNKMRQYHLAQGEREPIEAN